MPYEKTAFVLWADRFDEALAAFFVAEFRKAGLRVKLVSLAGQPSSGAYGLTLVPDLALEQALPLAHTASSVIIPCGTTGLSRLQNDPRLQEFLVQTHSAGAVFIVHQSGVNDLARSAWPFASKPEPVVYTDGDDALEAVRRVVG